MDGRRVRKSEEEPNPKGNREKRALTHRMSRQEGTRRGQEEPPRRPTLTPPLVLGEYKPKLHATPLTPPGTVVTPTTEASKDRRARGETGTLVPHWWGCPMVWPLWKPVRPFLKRLNTEPPLDQQSHSWARSRKAWKQGRGQVNLRKQ